jgi:type I restriction enzyme S subunit
VDELMALCDRLEQEQENSLETHETLVATLLNGLTESTASPEAFAEAWQRIQTHFDLLFTTESSIDQLKQTILQLAVMGKLVPQDPEDEPASTALEEIASERTALIKAGDLKKRKLLPPISRAEEPAKLPKHWAWCPLDVLITEMDAGWSPACPPTPSPSHDIWGVLKTTAVQVMEYREVENKVLDEGKSPRPQYEVRSGDILITRAGPKNRVGISCLVENTRPRLMISDKIIRFHLVEIGISERFISLCLNAGPTCEHLEKAKSGMAESQMNISQGKLRAAPIPLAPIEEQHRIVAKVDELFTLCDELKARLAMAQETQLYIAESLVEQAIG